MKKMVIIGWSILTVVMIKMYALVFYADLASTDQLDVIWLTILIEFVLSVVILVKNDQLWFNQEPRLSGLFHIYRKVLY